MHVRRPNALILALATGLTLTSLAPADAGFRRDRGYNGVEEGGVVAHSRYGNGSATGRVREARNGLQVQLPGGTWEYCRASCSETLRVETVDKFENADLKGYGTAAQECGIFGCLDVGIGWRD
jgi:hypothetical protein